MSVEDLLAQLRKQLTTLPDREPSSERARVHSLARAVAGMSETSPDCEACQRELPGFLDDERAGVPLEQRDSTVREHLSTCPTCSLMTPLTLICVGEGVSTLIPSGTGKTTGCENPIVSTRSFPFSSAL